MSPSPVTRGIGLAIAAAVLFGITAPLLKQASAGSGVFVTSALVYLGAALAAAGAAAFRGRTRAAAERARIPAVRLGVVALLGSVIAPALLVAGLKRIDGATASLLLALEAPLTVALARVLLGEFIGARVATAAVLITGGAAILVGASLGSNVTFAGSILVGAASLAWSLDNLVSRPLADLDPLGVVGLKGVLGAALSGLVAVALNDARPTVSHTVVLVSLGALGYGLSLVVYLRAQHVVGAARTASVFATAPFFGATAAFLMGAPWPGWGFLAAAVLIGIGVALHFTEHHDHAHRHEPIEHEHLHRHDDGHHDHVHEPMPDGPHSHAHRHTAVTHRHEHGQDTHHRHPHGHPHGDGK